MIQEEQIPKFHASPFLNDYLQMVEETESPRLFHIWCALSGIAACLGRRMHLPFGQSVIHPNLFVLLVGNPGTRKSSALKILTRILKEATPIRFSPQDTSGQRQGLFKAMQGEEADTVLQERVAYETSDTTLASIGNYRGLEDIEDVKLDEINGVRRKQVDDKDKHVMFVASEEFSRFIGQNNIQMLDFLVTVYDGDEFSYRIKSEEIKMKDTLLNLLGCTTPTSIATSMPVQAVGQGFMSRVILVHGEKKYKKLAWPKAPDQSLCYRVQQVFETTSRMQGIFYISQEAKDYGEKIYETNLGITDSRFIYYATRRYTHLLKVAMCLAAGNGEHIVGVEHMELAHRLLRITETGMPDCLGQFGLHKLGIVKQAILEHLRASAEPVALAMMYRLHSKDASNRELMQLIGDMLQAEEIQMTTKESGDKYLVAKRTATIRKAGEVKKDNAIEAFLTQGI